MENDKELEEKHRIAWVEAEYETMGWEKPKPDENWLGDTRKYFETNETGTSYRKVPKSEELESGR